LKKKLPYGLGFLALFILLVLIINSPAKKSRVFDERITLQHRDKIPYGTFISYQLLPHLFPDADISFSKNMPGPWHQQDNSDSNGAVFLMAKTFDPGDYDLRKISAFVKRGNYVFIIANHLSNGSARFFKVADRQKYFSPKGSDSLEVMLNDPPFAASTSYLYPGKQYDAYFTNIDARLNGMVLGKDNIGAPNFLQLQIGKGKLFIHLAPLAFSNYFLLHKNNVSYFQKATALIPRNVNSVIWNEYYLTKRTRQKEKNASPLSVLFKYPSFRAALLTALAFLLLYVLFEMRRRQRMIPIMNKPVNDSLDFVKTIGRLYYDQKDHKNLSKKMAVYFLDHVRTNYKLQPLVLDQSFVQALHQKSGYAVPELNNLVYFIKYIDDAPFITDDELARFYRQLELFYKNT
jgi:hypothetical protein